MIDAVEDMEEALGHENADGMPPARIEADRPGIVMEDEGAFRPTGREEVKNRQNLDAQLLYVRAD